MSETVQPDGYNTPVPGKIMTPDRVETRIGTLEFTDGFPTAKRRRRCMTISTSFAPSRCS